MSKPRLYMACFMLNLCVVGLLAITEPSPTLSALNLVTLYSFLLVVFAGLGTAAIFRSSKALRWSLYGITLATVIHAVSLLSIGSWQTGTRMFAGIWPLLILGEIWSVWSAIDYATKQKLSKPKGDVDA